MAKILGGGEIASFGGKFPPKTCLDKTLISGDDGRSVCDIVDIGRVLCTTILTTTALARRCYRPSSVTTCALSTATTITSSAGMTAGVYVVVVVVKFFNKNFVTRKVDNANIQKETDINVCDIVKVLLS